MVEGINRHSLSFLAHECEKDTKKIAASVLIKSLRTVRVIKGTMIFTRFQGQPASLKHI